MGASLNLKIRGLTPFRVHSHHLKAKNIKEYMMNIKETFPFCFGSESEWTLTHLYRVL